MEKSEANALFAEADALYRQGDYDEALVILDELFTRYPNEHRLMRARAETLAKLGRSDEALDLCDRLIYEFNYEKIRPLRDRLLSQGHGAGVPVPYVPPDDRDAQDDYEACELTEVKPSRFRIKPIRLLILIALVAGMYYQYVPYWLGGGLIALYFIIKWAIGRAIRKLFMLPFKMKAQPLKGATAEIHGVYAAPAPDPSELEAEDGVDDPVLPHERRWIYIDTTITPTPRTTGFTMWEPGELALAPGSLKYRSLDDGDKCLHIHMVWILEEGQEVDPGGMKYAGPRRIKVLAAVPSSEKSLQFVYYTEAFGRFTVPDTLEAAARTNSQTIPEPA